MAALALNDKKTESALEYLYGGDKVEYNRGRCASVTEGFEKYFGSEAEAIYSAPGRTELGGNHTDHQRGHVLAGAVDMDILAAVKPNSSGTVRLKSEGYPEIIVNLSELTPVNGEENSSAALIRGVAAKFAAMGADYTDAGFEAYLITSVPGGSGLSSSAAFEVLVGTIFNDLYFNNACDPIQIAIIGQYAENVYFGKPCGMLDQLAASVGGIAAMDLKEPNAPVVEKIAVNFKDYGYALCIMDSHASHADLTDEYSAITRELKAVCRFFGKEVLREVDEAEFIEALPQLRCTVGDRAVLRAFHVYADDKNAVAEAEAVKAGDIERYLELVRASGKSSAQYLQNVVPLGHVDDQALMLTIALAEKLLGGRGAVRVHGGGFGGTAQAYVPVDKLSGFIAGMEKLLGKNSVHVVRIRPVGGYRIV